MNERNANIELLRVIAMLMVTMLHALGHGGVLEQYDFGTFGYVFFWFIETFCYVAVNVFVLITGYFMIQSEFKISRVIKTFFQVEFFSILCLIAAKYIFHSSIGLKEFISAIFPFTSSTYWFVSAYIVLMVLAPVLNKLINTMNKRQHLMTLFILTGLFCVIPTFFFWSRELLGNGYNFVWFIVLYFTAAYIRLYGNAPYFSKKPWKYFVKNICFVGGGTASILIIGYFSTLVFGEPKGEQLFLTYNSIIIFPASLYFFLAFKNMSIKNRLVNKLFVSLGSVCFGVYLLTDHPLVRESIWNMIDFPRYKEQGVIILLIYVVAVVVIILLVGCLIECIRAILFRLTHFDKILLFFDNKFNEIKNKLSVLLDNL